MKTARILISGNEILSGRTVDANGPFLARALYVRGIRLENMTVLPDHLTLLSQWIRQNHGLSDYLFIAGGIGGTPDDVTRQAVAQALGRRLLRHPEAEQILIDYYREKINDERMNMADLPEGCRLIPNPVTKAPGFKIKNIYVFAGFPKIAKAMFEAIQDELQSSPMFEEVLNLKTGEGDLAHIMKQILRDSPLVELGSYPTLETDRGYRTQIVFRSHDHKVLDEAVQQFRQLCAEKSFSVEKGM